MSTVTLPNNVFQSQVCSECYQYLSYPPITVTKLGDKICGRCLPSLKATGADGENFAPSFANLVMEDVQFQCVNHFDGCKQLLGLEEVEEHEKQCKFEERECFFCSFHGNNWSQILNHCKAMHADSITKDARFDFSITKDYKETFILYVVENLILLIFITVNDEKFTAVIESAKKDEVQIKQLAVKFSRPMRESDSCYLNLDLSSENYFEKQANELTSRFGYGVEICCQFIVKQFSFSEIDLELERKCMHVSKLEARLLKKQEQIENEMSLVREQSDMLSSCKNVLKKLASTLFICQKCETQVIDTNIYFCPKNHGYCQKCLTRICTKCQKSCEFFKLPPDFSKIIVCCDWSGCPENEIPIYDFLEHKQYCRFRPYKCPISSCTAVLYSSQELCKHWHSAIPTLNIDDEYIICEQYGDFEFYWFVDNDLYHFIIEFGKQSLNIFYEPVDHLKEVPPFKCQGFGSNAWHDHGVFQNFCGKMQLTTNNYSNNYRLYFNKIRIGYH